MGEKETGTVAGGEAGSKAAPPRKDEPQRWVQDDTPEGESLRTVDKSSPELMRAAEGPDDSGAAERSAAMNSIRNLKA